MIIETDGQTKQLVIETLCDMFGMIKFDFDRGELTWDKILIVDNVTVDEKIFPVNKYAIIGRIDHPTSSLYLTKNRYGHLGPIGIKSLRQDTFENFYY